MIFRNALKEDVVAINALKIKSDLFHFGSNFPARALQPALTSDLIEKNYLLVAVEGSEIAGFIAYNFWEDEKILFIEQISTAVEHSRQGVATKLMNKILKKAQEKGSRSIGLTTNTQAVWSSELYKKFGFSAIAEDEIPAKAASILQQERLNKSANRAYLSLTI